MGLRQVAVIPIVGDFAPSAESPAGRLAEDQIGTMLPCNVIVQDVIGAAGMVEVAAIDPSASMAAVDSPQLAGVAQEAKTKTTTGGGYSPS